MTTASEQTAAARGWRRRFAIAGIVVGAVLAGAAFVGFDRVSAAIGWLRYEPQDGDVIFQSLPPGSIVGAIEGVTRSPYSHCGIVARKDGRWIVYEAYGEVSITPLATFLMRGRGGGFAVYRLREEHRGHIPATLASCETYVGRPYDRRYRLDDERIYCSELVSKAYRDATGGLQLGLLTRFGDMNWQPYEALIREVEGGEVPVDREMITPAGLARAPELEPVFSHNMAFEPTRVGAD